MGDNGVIDSIARYLASYRKEDPPQQETTTEPAPDLMGFYRVESDTVDAKCFDSGTKSTVGSDTRLMPGALIHINDRNLFSAIKGLDKVDSLAGSCLRTRWLASE